MYIGTFQDYYTLVIFSLYVLVCVFLLEAWQLTNLRGREETRNHFCAFLSKIIKFKVKVINFKK